MATFRLRSRRFTPLREVWQALFRTHRGRTLVGLSLAQAFFYNAIFFTYALGHAEVAAQCSLMTRCEHHYQLPSYINPMLEDTS